MARSISLLAVGCLVLWVAGACDNDKDRPAGPASLTAPASDPAAGPGSARAGSPTTAPAGATEAAKPGIPIVLVDMPLYDGGNVWAGDPLKHTFTLRNVGTADLRIVKVRPGCRCTAAGEHPEVIPPGGSGEFPFRVAVQMRADPFPCC